MRALKVVDRPPVVEGALQFTAVREPLPLQHFRLQAAVKTLQLSLRLRMVRPRVSHPDAVAHQPQLHCRPGAGGVAPRRAVVHRHPVRQAVALKDADQLLLYRLTPFVSAVHQAQREPGVIVQQGKRVAAAAAKGKVALKIHLPEPVRGRMLKPAGGRDSRRCARQQAVAGHQVVDGAEGRHAVPRSSSQRLILRAPQC